MPTGTEPIEDGESLYRRVSESATPPEFDAEKWTPSPRAFQPKRYDKEGLSVYRKKYLPPKELAQRGAQGKQYYVIEVEAGCLRRLGITVAPNPQPNDPGHALLTNMDAENRRSDAVLEWMEQIVLFCIKNTHGPFEGQKPREP